MEYQYLNGAQQKELLQQRMANLEAEHFNHSVNVELIQSAIGDGEPSEADAQALADAQAALATIESVHAEVQAIIADIDESAAKPDGVPTPPVTRNRAARRSAGRAKTS